MYVFAAKIDPDKPLIQISYAFSEKSLVLIVLKMQKRFGDIPNMLEGYPKTIKETNQIKVQQYCRKLAGELTVAGYIPILGNGLQDQNKYKLYVIHIDNPDSNKIYVGSTCYPIYTRYLQHKHKLQWAAANVFRNSNHEAHSLALDLIPEKSEYETQYEAEINEISLANKLRKNGYDVIQA